MAAFFMASCYQADLRFTSEQTGNVRRIERVISSGEPEANGELDVLCVLALRLQDEHAGAGDGPGLGIELFRRLPPPPHPSGSLRETKTALPPRRFVLPVEEDLGLGI